MGRIFVGPDPPNKSSLKEPWLVHVLSFDDEPLKPPNRLPKLELVKLDPDGGSPYTSS
jgi:hypothetical protein